MSDNVVVFSVTGLLGNFARAMVFPHTSLYIIALGGDVRTIGLVNFLRPLAGLFMFPIAGHLADRTSRVKLNCPEQLPICRLCPDVCPGPKLAGGCPCGTAARCGSSGLSTPLSAYRRLTITPEDRSRGIETMNTISSVFSIFASYLVGVVVDMHGANTGIRMLYGGMMLLYLASAFIHLRFPKETMSVAGDVFLASSLPRVVREAYYGCLHC